jgi:hypothetical protein
VGGKPTEAEVAKAVSAFRLPPEDLLDMYESPLEAASDVAMPVEAKRYYLAIATEVQFAVEDGVASLQDRSRAAAHAAIQEKGGLLQTVAAVGLLDEGIRGGVLGERLRWLLFDVAENVTRRLLQYLGKKKVLRVVS